MARRGRRLLKPHLRYLETERQRLAYFKAGALLFKEMLKELARVRVERERLAASLKKGRAKYEKQMARLKAMVKHKKPKRWKNKAECDAAWGADSSKFGSLPKRKSGPLNDGTGH